MEWRDVVGFESLYEVSASGDVRRVGKASTLRQHVGGGYKKVSLGSGDAKRTMAVHKIVAMAFVPNTSGRLIVEHINGNKLDNSANNLQWAPLEPTWDESKRRWRVKLARADDGERVKYFSAATHGGQNGALSAALEWAAYLTAKYLSAAEAE